MIVCHNSQGVRTYGKAKVLCYEENSKEVLLWNKNYSFHLGSDKNKSKLARKVAKGNLSGTTSLSNNAIQNAKDLSDVNKHNLRDYE